MHRFVSHRSVGAGVARRASLSRLLLLLTLTALPATAHAEGGEGRTGRAGIFGMFGAGGAKDGATRDGSADGSANGDQDVIALKHSFGKQLRIVTVDMLGTAAVGGFILSRFNSGPRTQAVVNARVSPNGEAMEPAGGGSAATEPIVTPEPGTIVLLATGLLALVVTGSRRSWRELVRLPHRSSHRRGGM
jgi:hypothetical protein